jgi:nucleoside 2-deoxyribosyltransferase
MKTVYVAGPLFTFAEQAFNRRVGSIVEYVSFNGEQLEVILPQEACAGMKDTKQICQTCIEGVDRSDIIVAILDGADADSGTCWEVGYAYAKKKHIIGLRTDFRGSGDTGGFNAMLAHTVNVMITGNGFEQQLIKLLAEVVSKPVKIRPELKPHMFKNGRF